jgi:hypothetical protein
MRRRGAIAWTVIGLLVLAGCERTHPLLDPRDPRVVAARERARNDIDAEAIVAQSVLAGAHEFARIEANTCQAGENNWKFKDSFYSQCQLDVATGLAYGGDFRQSVKALDELLLGRGWTTLGGVDHWLDRWDGEAGSIGKQPLADYIRGDSHIWIIFGSTETLGDTWLHDITCDLARGTDTNCTRTQIDGYYSQSTGTPWATAWENAGRPGPLMIVLHFTTVYAKDLR